MLLITNDCLWLVRYPRRVKFNSLKSDKWNFQREKSLKFKIRETTEEFFFHPRLHQNHEVVQGILKDISFRM